MDQLVERQFHSRRIADVVARWLGFIVDSLCALCCLASPIKLSALKRNTLRVTRIPIARKIDGTGVQ
jgi:hypothetical protein